MLAALRAAADAGLLVTDADRLRWRHALTRDAVLAAVLPPERAATAARVAAALDARDEPGDRAMAAELHLVAGHRETAAGLLLDLARRDAGRGAVDSAADLLDRAAATGVLAGRVAADRVRVLTLRGRVADALAVGAAALDGGPVHGDEHAELCLRLARTAVTGGLWAESQRWVARAGRPDDPRSLVLRADAVFGAGDRARAAAIADAAVHAAESEHDTADGAATLCDALMVAARTRDDPDLAGVEQIFARAEQVAAERGLVPWQVAASFGRGSVQLSRGDPGAPGLAEARALAERHGMLAQVSQADVLLGDATLARDGPARARELIEPAAARAGRLQMSGLAAMAELEAAAVAGLADDRVAMEELLVAATSRAGAPVEVATLGPAVRATPALVRHDLPRAAAGFDAGVTALLPHGSAAPTHWFGLWVLLRTAVADRDEEARAALGEHHSVRAVVNRAGLVHAEAIAAGRAGRHDEAVARYTEADALLVRMPWWRRLVRSVVLDAAIRDGWGDPVPTLRVDLAAALAADEQALARTCRDLLRAAGAPTRTRGPGPPAALRAAGVTAREAEVLALLVEHRSNAEIAGRLHLSPRTVESHVARLLAKSGTTDRATLRSWATDRA